MKLLISWRTWQGYWFQCQSSQQSWSAGIGRQVMVELENDRAICCSRPVANANTAQVTDGLRSIEELRYLLRVMNQLERESAHGPRTFCRVADSSLSQTKRPSWHSSHF